MATGIETAVRSEPDAKCSELEIRRHGLMREEGRVIESDRQKNSRHRKKPGILGE